MPEWGQTVRDLECQIRYLDLSWLAGRVLIIILVVTYWKHYLVVFLIGILSGKLYV